MSDRWTEDEARRYSRHFVLPEVGEEGQQRLRSAAVAVVGVGGLGSPVALYLAAAGVGTIALIEPDRVDVSNLQRQILYDTSDAGSLKVSRAAERLRSLNPNIRIIEVAERLFADNAPAILAPYKIVVDATDNFAARYLINDACVLAGAVDVYGSVYRFEGEVSVFDSRRGPCYRCLRPRPPEPHLVPGCAEGGVLGALPGIVGTLQAAEVLKLLLEIGEPLIGSVLHVDVLGNDARKFAITKDPDCPVCGKNPSIRGLVDGEACCGTPSGNRGGRSIGDVTVEQLKKKMDAKDDFVLLDVREKHEYDFANLGGVLIPLKELPSRFEELNPQKEIVVYCHRGVRSLQAVEFLESRGFSNVHNLVGGIDAWSSRIDPAVKIY